MAEVRLSEFRNLSSTRRSLLLSLKGRLKNPQVKRLLRLSRGLKPRNLLGGPGKGFLLELPPRRVRMPRQEVRNLSIGRQLRRLEDPLLLLRLHSLSLEQRLLVLLLQGLTEALLLLNLFRQKLFRRSQSLQKRRRIRLR